MVRLHSNHEKRKGSSRGSWLTRDLVHGKKRPKRCKPRRPRLRTKTVEHQRDQTTSTLTIVTIRGPAEIKQTTDLLEENQKLHAEKVAKDIKDFKHQLILRADVICTTLDACIDKDLEEIYVEYEKVNYFHLKFHYLSLIFSLLFCSKKADHLGQIIRPFLCCIIDDASLCTGPESLIPLVLGVNKLILVGDVEYLPFNLFSSVFLALQYLALWKRSIFISFYIGSEISWP